MHDTVLYRQQATVNVSTQTPVKAEGIKLPGDPGIWTFITADVFLFCLFFLVFSVERLSNPELYEQSRQLLNANFGLANTLILLTSSWFMVLAVEAAREGHRDSVKRNLMLAMLVGLGFAVLKITEYTIKIQAGITPQTNPFFTYYYAFTAIHFIHFLAGMGVMLVCFFKARREPIDNKYLVWIESSGSYWHMVDMLWIVLFPMLYLLRASS
ncbi:MAG: cytochrome c oxidase subunit 3 [Desulfobacterales bacterium]|jgi:nitric oxide reductase NorE protein|nr:cytochrome c oxidase subunit 3 [Desulfobacterales bacterium]